MSMKRSARTLLLLGLVLGAVAMISHIGRLLILHDLRTIEDNCHVILPGSVTLVEATEWESTTASGLKVRIVTKSDPRGSLFSPQWWSSTGVDSLRSRDGFVAEIQRSEDKLIIVISRDFGAGGLPDWVRNLSWRYEGLTISPNLKKNAQWDWQLRLH